MLILLTYILAVSFGGLASIQEEREMKDSVGHTLAESLKKGRFNFHTRSYFMSTVNQGELLDYSTLATGAGMGVTSPQWKGFQARFSGFFIFQVFENNLRIADPTTGAGNRYEILLFDMNDLSNTNRLDRMEELYLSYQRNKFKVIFGRQKLNSPLLNEQDNRMRPNIFGGLSLYHHGDNLKWTMAWITSMTLRGTTDWYGVGESFGVYPFGRNPFGEPSKYKFNTQSKGLAMMGLQYQKNGLHLQGWNYWAENVFNMSFGQAEYKFGKGSLSADLGLQGFYQIPVGQGGNEDVSKRYIMPEEKTSGIGTKLGLESGRNKVSINFFGINDQGRFLFPREWGREILFASLPRERYEGAGDLKAWVLKYHRKIPVEGMNAQFGLGKVDHSTGVRTNKYGIPSYYHFTGALDYKFKGFLEGLDVQVLVVNKTAQKPEEVPDRLRINRVDMWNFNLVVDYRF